MCPLFPPRLRNDRPRGLRRDGCGRFCTLVATALFVLAPQMSRGGELELWRLWQLHLNGLEEHAKMVSACNKYAAANPGDAFLPVVRGIQAWHLLHADKKPDAIRIFSTQLKGGKGSVDLAAKRLSRGWVTRFLREQVMDSLQYYYRKEVRYPAKLDQLAAYPGLPNADKLPLKDAWGSPWRYRLAGFDGVPGFRDQKYDLESSSTQPPWDVADALALPYAEQFKIQATRAAGSSAAGPVMVKLEFLDPAMKGKVAVGQVGSNVESFTLAYAGKELVVLCDTLHWKIVRWKK